MSYCLPPVYDRLAMAVLFGDDLLSLAHGCAIGKLSQAVLCSAAIANRVVLAVVHSDSAVLAWLIPSISLDNSVLLMKAKGFRLKAESY